MTVPKGIRDFWQDLNEAMNVISFDWFVVGNLVGFHEVQVLQKLYFLI